MFSILNSYDYKNQFTTKEVKLPFIGDYEPLDKYQFIYIHAFSTKNDLLTIEFSNKQNDIQYEFNLNQYTMKPSIPLEIIIPKKLNFFRTNITLSQGSEFRKNDRRVYSVYLLETQYIPISIKNDPSGSFLVGIDTNIISSVLPNGASTEATLSSLNNKVVVCDTSNTKIFAKRISDNTQTQLESDVNNRLITSSYILDGSGNSIKTVSGKLDIYENYLFRDGLNKLKISNQNILFESKNLDAIDYKFTNYPTSNNGIEYIENSSIVELNCNNISPVVIYESKLNFIYQIGKSVQILNCFMFGNVINNTSSAIQKVGFFGNYDGIYLQIDSNNISICKLSSTYANIEQVELENWNGDEIAKNLDFTKIQLFWINIEWNTSIRTGFFYDGKFILAHEFNFINTTISPFIKTPQLPIRYEIQNSNLSSYWEFAKEGIIPVTDSNEIYYNSMITQDNYNYVCGKFECPVEINFGNSIIKQPYTPTTNTTGFIGKFDLSGNFQWVCRVGLSSKSIEIIDLKYHSDYIYVVGNYEASNSNVLNFENADDTIGVQLQASAINSNDMFIAKINLNGQWQWARRIASSSSNDNIIGLTIFNNDIYITGYYGNAISTTIRFYDNLNNDTININSVGSQDIFVGKINSSGVWQWCRTIGSSNQSFSYSIENINNTIVITGKSTDDLYFKTNITSTKITSLDPLQYDSFIICLNSSGSFEWISKFSNAVNDTSIKSIVVDNSYIYIVGFFEGIGEDLSLYRPGDSFVDLTVKSLSNKNLFIGKLLSNGHWLWAQNIYDINNSDDININTTKLFYFNNNLYLFGNFKNSISFRDSNYMEKYISSSGNDFFLTKYSTDGICKYAVNLNNSNSTGILSLSIINDDEFFIAGNYDNTITFGDTVLDNNGGGFDNTSYIAKFKLDSNVKLQFISSCVLLDGEYNINSKLKYIGSDSNSSIINMNTEGVDDDILYLCAISVINNKNTIVLPQEILINLNYLQYVDSTYLPVVEYRVIMINSNKIILENNKNWINYRDKYRNEKNSGIKYLLYDSIDSINFDIDNDGIIIKSGFLEKNNIIKLNENNLNFNLQLGKNIISTSNNNTKFILNYNYDAIVVVLKILSTASSILFKNISYKISWYEF
jgi:hypothetical protein